MSVTLTVYFDGSFFAALSERIDSDGLRAAKHVFGPEPSDPEVYQWVLREFARLRYSPAVEGARRPRAAGNPKRRQRQAAQACASGVGTRAQQALQLQREQSAQERRSARRTRSEAEEARKFQLRQEKKKARRRGH